MKLVEQQLAQRFYHLGLMFVVLVIIPVANNTFVITNLISEVWDCSDIPKNAEQGKKH